MNILAKKLLLMVCGLLIAVCTFAQGTTSKKAQRLFEDAQEAFRNRDIDRGIQLLERAVAEDPGFMTAVVQLADTYNMIRQPEKAAAHLRKIVENAPTDRKYANAYYQVAILDFEQGDYAKAKAGMEKFLGFNPPPHTAGQAKRIIANSNYALEGMKHPVEFKPRMLPPSINRLRLQYFPALSADQQTLIFTGRVGTRKEQDENMYAVSKTNDGNWAEPEHIREINTFYNEGTCTISADGRMMIFTVCGGSEERAVVGECDLFVTYNEGGKWQTPQNMGMTVNTQYWETQPSLSADGRTLYFISTRPGGVGGSDIWRTHLDDNGKWTRPENLGKGINTSAEESAPFIHVNGHTLFFCSEGYPGYGGFDLYKSELTPTGWQKPENLGYPLNDHRNQMGLFITADGKKGYYSQGKPGPDVLSTSDIYEFDLPAELTFTASHYVKGTVYDAKTKKKLQAKIDLINLATDSVESTVHSDAVNGDYLIVLNQGAEYALYVNKEGYLFESLTFNYTGKENKDVVIDIYLDPIEKGSRVTLNNIFFDFSKWSLQDKSKTELNRLLKFMKTNKDIKIEISGHTDDVGSDAFNLELSQKRAQAVVAYLTKAGIEATRLVSKGYGETAPLKPNDSDENRAMNRRIEFKIL